jgi:hypothetical protein
LNEGKSGGIKATAIPPRKDLFIAFLNKETKIMFVCHVSLARKKKIVIIKLIPG